MSLIEENSEPDRSPGWGGAVPTGLTPTLWAWPRGVDARQQWQAWAHDADAWLKAQGRDVRDAIVVVPVGALLPLVRQAWADAVGGWMPQIDTIAGLMEQHAWRYTPAPAGAWGPAMTLDVVMDRLAVKASLRAVPWLDAWVRPSPAALDFAVDQVVQAGHAWWRRLQTSAPSERARLIGCWQEEFPPPTWTPVPETDTPGQHERWLLAWALQWALGNASAGFPSDALFTLQPSAWLAVSAGTSVLPGSEGALTLSVLGHAQSGAGAGHGAAPAVAWWAAHAVANTDADSPVLLATQGLEDEARQATAQVMKHVAIARQAGAAAARLIQPPVALLALDRSVIRRMRAMLDEHGVSVADETGWKLSTTRAAAALTRFVRAAPTHASSDDVLDWLKSAWTRWMHDTQEPSPLAELERWCRRQSIPRLWLVLNDPAPDQLTPVAWTTLQEAHTQLAPLRDAWSGGRLPLSAWLSALEASLVSTGAWDGLVNDPAGLLACECLRLPGAGVDAGPGWGGLCQRTMLDGGGFLRWMQDVMEAVVFRPAPPPGQPPEVVVTTLARAALRPFSAIVIPGADERQLGAASPSTGWLSQAQRTRLALSGQAEQQAAQWDAFSLAMLHAGVVCLHRKDQEGEHVSASPWIQRWREVMRQDWATASSALVQRGVPVRPVTQPSPTLLGHEDLLPMKVSATRYEALRQCPYQFFARSVLGLQEQDELEEGVDGADHGELLHAVLQRFHQERNACLVQRSPAQDVAAWLSAAEAVIREHGLDRDSTRPYFRPYQAQLPRLAEAYVDWCLAHEQQGWRVQHMEFDARLNLSLESGALVCLEGRLDRVDVRSQADHEPHKLVIDYKSGNKDKLSKRLKAPLEDTQLLFYAVLAAPDAQVEAAYLHLGKDTGTQAESGDMKATMLAHKDIESHTERFLQGLAQDWTALMSGHGMPALGEGEACEYCQARGLCRKDDWTPA